MRHQSLILAVTLIFAYVGFVHCATISKDIEESRSSLNDIEEKLDPSERLFFTSNALNFGGNGATSITIGNAGYVLLGAYVLIPLIVGLALLFYLLGGQGDRGGYGDYGHDLYGSTGGSSSYGGYARFVKEKNISSKNIIMLISAVSP